MKFNIFNTFAHNIDRARFKDKKTYTPVTPSLTILLLKKNSGHPIVLQLPNKINETLQTKSSV